MELDLTALISDLQGRVVLEGNPPRPTSHAELLTTYLSLHARGDSARLIALAEKIQKGKCEMERHDAMFLLDEVKKAGFAPVADVYITKKLHEILNGEQKVEAPKEIPLKSKKDKRETVSR